MKKSLLLLTLYLAAAAPGWAAGTCELAYEVAAKAAESFAKDKAAGLRLFIKARELCESDPSLAYNLGVAYYQYGRLTEAGKYLEEAVRGEGENPRWRNNLAAVLIESGQGQRALTHAEKAVQLSGDEPAYRDTLVQAQLAADKIDEAFRSAAEAREKWPSDKLISRSYDVALDAFLARYLQMIRDGQVEKGLAGLRRADSSPEAVATYCRALAKLGRPDRALSEAAAARERFRGDSRIQELFGEVLEQSIRGFYLDFRSGRTARAVQAAKTLHETYPGESSAKKAYDELFNAFLADASTIDVPAAASVSRPAQTSGGRADALLAGLGSAADAEEPNLDLSVDVDQNIPRGSIRRPYAVAVVIGNQGYGRQGKGIGDVRYAGRDAAVMKKYLQTTMGFDPKNIIFRTDATSGDLRSIFGSRENRDSMLRNYVRPGESEVFIYYVGHGAPGPDGKSAYLVPVDAQADYIASTGYPLDLFYGTLEELPAKRITVVLDACFSGDSPAGSLFRNISPAMVKNVKPVREVANTVIFSSADKDQVSTWYPAKRHSLFTYFFLKGLGGEADADRNRAITAGEMERYLKKEVPFWAQREANRKQTPLVVGDASAVLAKLK